MCAVREHCNVRTRLRCNLSPPAVLTSSVRGGLRWLSLARHVESEKLDIHSEELDIHLNPARRSWTST